MTDRSKPAALSDGTTDEPGATAPTTSLDTGLIRRLERVVRACDAHRWTRERAEMTVCDGLSGHLGRWGGLQKSPPRFFSLFS